MNFLCDHMLGTLARWLRFMGYDTAYPGPLDDTELLGLARREDRILLTRDKELASRSPRAFRVRSDTLDEQVRELASALPLKLIDPLSRCSVCNTPLVAAKAEEVGNLVPEGVRTRHVTFWQCPGCHKIYWQGSHWDRMIERLDRFDLPKSP